MIQHPVAAALAAFLLLLPAHASGATTAAESAGWAFEREFSWFDVSASAPEIAEAFRSACADGYEPACGRAAWQTPTGPSLASAARSVGPLCDAGDATACVVVAWHQAETASLSAATRPEWTTSARRLDAYCRQGDHRACHALADVLLAGRGVQPDAAGAVARLGESCTAGHGPSCTTLASRASGGDSRVPGTPIEFATKGCAAGDPAACAMVVGLDGQAWERGRSEPFLLEQCLAGHGDSCVTLVDRAKAADWVLADGRIEKWLYTGCRVGSGLACGRLGDFRREEVGDLVSAASLYERACSLGAWEACGGLAAMVLAGEIDSTVMRSRATFEAACERGGDQLACSALGSALMNEGKGAESKRARDLLEQGCVDRDSPAAACAELGRFYETGLSAARDRTTASKLYSWACAAGDARSCHRRGLLVREGVGVVRDNGLALQLFDKACEGGVAEACQAAGEHYDNGTSAPRDADLARQRFADACSGRVLLGCNRLGLLLEEVGDPASAHDAYQAAIDLGSIEAKRLQARLLWFGEGVKKRRGLARELCREACQAGDPNACLGPNFQLAARAAVGKRDAALMPAVAPPPPEVVQVPRPNLAEGMAWLPRPVCEWQPSQVAADTLFANAWRLEPLIVDASSRLSGVAPAPAPEPEVAKEPERRPKRRAAAVPEDLGLLIVGSWPGDKVTIGGEDVPSAADGVVVYEGPEGAVDFEVTGGGRSEAYPVVVTPGYAVWVDVAQPPVARVLFPVNGAVLDEAAQAVVDAVASRAGTWTFSITGSYSAEGDIGRNLALARARAAATRAALIGAGVSAEAVEVGQPQPPEPGLSMEEQRAAVVRPQAPEGM